MKRLAIFLLLAGCSASVPPVTRIVTISPIVPGDLLHCKAPPDVPVTNSQSIVAKYIVALWLAGDDCRAHVAAISQVLNK
jgi:hypothetical protein